MSKYQALYLTILITKSGNLNEWINARDGRLWIPTRSVRDQISLKMINFFSTSVSFVCLFCRADGCNESTFMIQLSQPSHLNNLLYVCLVRCCQILWSTANKMEWIQCSMWLQRYVTRMWNAIDSNAGSGVKSGVVGNDVLAGCAFNQ